MRKCYVHSAVSISAQDTFDSDNFLDNAIQIKENKVKAIHPNYKEYISAVASRRMSPAVKMGVTAAYKALEQASLEQPDAIITGTGMGCLADTEKFLNNIIDNDEAFLTPTSFIQSTHNTVAAQIALGLKCNAYNNTFTHGSLSFESALIDAQLLLQQNQANSVLVGSVDELGNEFIDYIEMVDQKENEGINVPFSEGATFSVLSSQRSDSQVQLVDIATVTNGSIEEITSKLKAFLNENDFSLETIDAIILGTNGDAYDGYYDAATTLFSDASQIQYKHLSGEYDTVSAFGFWLGVNILEKGKIPKAVLQHSFSKSEPKTILLYNQHKGKNHSFILLHKC